MAGSAQPTFHFPGLELPLPPISPLSPSAINTISPSGIFQLRQRSPSQNPPFANHIPFSLSDQYDLYISGQSVSGENDPHTQEETDMSTTEEDSTQESAPFKATEKDKERAQAWFSELGLDCDAVKFDIQKLQQARSGLLTDIGTLKRHTDTVNNLLHVWETSRNTIHVTSETIWSDLPNAKDMEEGMQRAHAGLVQAQQAAEQEKCSLLAESAGLQAKLSVVQDVFSILEDCQHLPLCPICTLCPADRAAQPCGHMYCEECAQKMMRQPNPAQAHARRSSTSRPCYICRAQCKGFMKTHFS